MEMEQLSPDQKSCVVRPNHQPHPTWTVSLFVLHQQTSFAMDVFTLELINIIKPSLFIIFSPEYFNSYKSKNL